MSDGIMGEDLEQQHRDEDAEYERFRDDWCDRLDEVIRDTYNAFVKTTKSGYYKDNDEKFFEHIISILEDITSCRVEVINSMQIDFVRAGIVRCRK